MKKYIKPEIDFVEFVSEKVMDVEQGGTSGEGAEGLG